MKRITYISRFARPISHGEIDQLEQLANHRNQAEEITGVLLCAENVFIQTIEGEDRKIDRLYSKILRDTRHKDILCLKTELNIPARKYPDWSMKTLYLDEADKLPMKPLSSLFKVLEDSQRILQRYTQPALLKFIRDGIHPLEIHPRRVEKVILFCDIVGFSIISSHLSVEEMLKLVNTFLSTCSERIAAFQGEITNIMGDCVMAYFEGDQVDQALQVSMDILKEMEQLRRKASADSPLQVLHCGIGMDHGEVIEGNIGSHDRMEYTILGTPVNTAAYLESLTRSLPYALALSDSVRRKAQQNWDFVDLGEYALKQNLHPVPVHSIESPPVQKPFNAVQMMNRIQSVLKAIHHQESIPSSDANP